MNYIERLRHYRKDVPEEYHDAYERLLEWGCGPRIAAATLAYVEGQQSEGRAYSLSRIGDEYGIAPVTIRGWRDRIWPEVTGEEWDGPPTQEYLPFHRDDGLIPDVEVVMPQEEEPAKSKRRRHPVTAHIDIPDGVDAPPELEVEERNLGYLYDRPDDRPTRFTRVGLTKPTLAEWRESLERATDDGTLDKFGIATLLREYYKTPPFDDANVHDIRGLHYSLISQLVSAIEPEDAPRLYYFPFEE